MQYNNHKKNGKSAKTLLYRALSNSPVQGKLYTCIEISAFYKQVCFLDLTHES